MEDVECRNEKNFVSNRRGEGGKKLSRSMYKRFTTPPIDVFLNII